MDIRYSDPVGLLPTAGSNVQLLGVLMSTGENVNISLPIVIQVTNVSTFLERRPFIPLCNEENVLSYLVHRIRDFWDAPVVVATTVLDVDNEILELAKSMGVMCCRGDPKNLVERLIDVSLTIGRQQFVRLMGNYPIVDLGSMSSLVNEHIRGCFDYSYNEHADGVPWGMGCEVIHADVLKKLCRMELSEDQKEVGTLYLRQNAHAFKIYRAVSSIKRPNYKLCLETEMDLRLLRDVVHHLPEPSLNSVVAYLDDHPVFASMCQEVPPKEVGVEKLALHPSKIAAFHHAMHGEPDMIYPVSVELSLTNRCNLYCAWCSDRALRERQGIENDLPGDILFRLFEDLKRGGTKGVVLEGGGEPTIRSDFGEIFDRLLSIGLPVGLITNGTMELSPRMLKSFEWIRVSLDAANAEDYKLYKGKDLYETVLSNICRYAKCCPTVGVGYVVTNQNIDDVEALVLRLRQYDVSYVHFRPVVDCPDMLPRGATLSYLSRYQTPTFSVIVDGMNENMRGGNGNMPCVAHSLSSVISSEGSVYLCGRLNIHEWFKPIGNLRDQSFHEVWNGAERRKQIRSVLDTGFCMEHCPPCRMSKYNNLFVRAREFKTPNFI